METNDTKFESLFQLGKLAGVLLLQWGGPRGPENLWGSRPSTAWAENYACGQWRRNEFESGGTDSDQKWGHRSGSKSTINN